MVIAVVIVIVVVVVSTTVGLREFLGREDEVGCIAVVGRVGFVCRLDVMSVAIIMAGKKSGGLHVWV